MRIAYVIPKSSYAFFREVIPHLEDYGHRLIVNPSNLNGFDIAWAAMLPQTKEWSDTLQASGIPTVLWHWDQFSFVNYADLGWRTLYDMMPNALEIWSASYETARLLKTSHGYESWVVGSWVNPSDFEPPYYQGDFVFYAAPYSAFHKRVAWVELACNRLGIPFRQTYQGSQGLSRHQYCELMRCCRCYVMAAFEESNGTIPTLEAALCNKPVLLSDLPACHEEFGRHATYFKTWDFGDFMERLNDVYHGKHPSVDEARERIVKLFAVENVARRIAGRLKELEARL